MPRPARARGDRLTPRPAAARRAERCGEQGWSLLSSGSSRRRIAQRRERLLVIPSREIDLRATARAAGGPGKPLAVRGRHRESVETFGVSDAHWLLHSRSIDDEQLEVREPELVGRE